MSLALYPMFRALIMKFHDTGDMGGMDVLPLDFLVLWQPESDALKSWVRLPRGILKPVSNSGLPTASSREASEGWLSTFKNRPLL